jgi:hypothetical protein
VNEGQATLKFRRSISPGKVTVKHKALDSILRVKVNLTTFKGLEFRDVRRRFSGEFEMRREWEALVLSYFLQIYKLLTYIFYIKGL